jgi:hypothetical protein
MRRLVRRGQLGFPWPSSCLPNVLFGSRAFLALRCMAPGMILGKVTSWCSFTWQLSLPTCRGGGGSMWTG